VSSSSVDAIVSDFDGIHTLDTTGKTQSGLAHFVTSSLHGRTLFVDCNEHGVQVLTWYRDLKQRCPSLSAYFLVLAKGLRNTEWIPYLRRMKLKRISKLVSGACLHLTAEGLWKPYQEEICVMYDAPYQQVNAMSNPIQDAQASEGLCMQYVGALAKVPVNVLFDTGPEQSFVSTSFLRSAGLWPFLRWPQLRTVLPSKLKARSLVN
jgi:hypothetical protein